MAVPLKLSLSNRMSCHGLNDVNQSTNSAQLAKAEREIKVCKLALFNYSDVRIVLFLCLP